MFFVLIYGIPKETSEAEQVNLRKGIVKTIARDQGLSPSWIRLFFVPDSLPDPELASDGAKTILVVIYTDLFEAMSETDARPKRACDVISEFVYLFFNGRYEVLCCINEFRSATKTLLFLT